MRTAYIPFFAFLALLVMTIPIPFNISTSVVPGWHTTIFPPAFIWGLAVMIVLLLATIGYWLLSIRADKINWTLFALHVLLTLPILILPEFPFLYTQQANEVELIKAISLQIKLTAVLRTLFVFGQILFIIYFIRTINSKRFAK